MLQQRAPIYQRIKQNKVVSLMETKKFYQRISGRYFDGGRRVVSAVLIDVRTLLRLAKIIEDYQFYVTK